MKVYLNALGDRPMIYTSLRVALLVGTLLFCINHGSAVVQGKMTRARRVSALLTYLVPCCVSFHGQVSSSRTKYEQQEGLERQYEPQEVLRR